MFYLYGELYREVWHHGIVTGFPCPANGYKKTLCGPLTPYCNMSQSCAAKLDTSKFVPGMKVKSYVSIEKVWNYANYTKYAG